MTQEQEARINNSIGQIEANQANLIARVTDIQTRLFGNGQPGELDKHNRRIAELERLKNKALGAAVVLGGCMGLFGGSLILRLFGKI